MNLQKILNFFTKAKIQKQLYTIFFIAIFIPIVLIGNYLIYNSRSLLLKHYEDQSYSDMLRVKSLLLDLTSDIHSKAEILAADKDMVQLLSTEYSTAEEAWQAIQVYEGFQTLLTQTAAVESISVYTWNTTLPESKYIHQIDDRTWETDWFVRASAQVAPFWSTETRQDGTGYQQAMPCLNIRIFLPKINNFAMLRLTVSNNHIKNRIENSSLNTILWLGEDEMFYSSSGTDTGTALFSYAKGTGKTYTGRIELDGRSVIGCVSTLSTAYSDDLFHMASLNYDGYSYINKITGIYLAIILLILIVTSTCIHIYSRHFSRRVITLRATMHEVSNGNYNVIDTFEGEDEISEAFKDLNVMIQDILRKEASVYEAQIREQELINQQQQMEFKMLSSQINPHFLYNTLETIRMRSLKAGNREVANAVKLLGKSMRYVLENTTASFTTLERELDYINTYLSIQKLRFHDKVNYTLKTPPDVDLAEYRIMPLLMQPIVENALLHGLEEVEENGRIIIHIDKNEQTLRIGIFDNGCGMTSGELKLMLQNIYHHPKESSKSIGLANIYQRIQLYCGPEYGLSAKSKKHFGTLITLILPAQDDRGGD